MGADSSNGGGSRSGDSVGGLAIVVRTETWGTGDRGPRTGGGGGRCQRPTSREPTLVCLEVLKKKSLGRGRPGQDGDRTGQGQVGRRFPFSLFISLSLSQPCAVSVSRAQASDPLAPGAGAGWVVLLAGGGRPAWRRSRQWYSGWGVGRLALVRGRHPHSRGRHPPRAPRDGPEVVFSSAAGRLTRAVPGSPTGGREGWKRGPPRKGVKMGGKVGVNGKWGRQRGKREGKRGQEREMPGWGHASATRQRGKWEMENKKMGLFASASLPPPPQASEREKKNSRRVHPPRRRNGAIEAMFPTANHAVTVPVQVLVYNGLVGVKYP